MKITDRIILSTNNGIIFDLELRNEVIVVEGNSGTGKTFFFTTLNNAIDGNLQEMVKGINLRDIIMLNVSSKKLVNIFMYIKEQKNKLIIIDNGCSLLNSEIAEYIGADLNNQYLIFCRDEMGFGISPNYFAEMHKNNGLHTLYYKYNVRGWR